MNRRTALLAILIMAATLSPILGAGRLIGTVMDERGAPLQGVAIEAVSQEGQARSAATDVRGRFEIVDLAAGTYAITATLAGIAPTIREGVVVAEGSETRVSLAIDVVAASERLAVVNVTARRVTETLQRAPVTVTAIPEQVVQANRVETLDEFVELVPNATVPEDAFGTKQVINIRGVTSPDLTAEPGLGLFRNGQYYGGIITNLGSLIDVERVEILRGPQGGLYGRNALGGAMNVIVATPKSDFDAKVDARYGTFDLVETSAVVNVPVIEGKLLARIVGWSYEQSRGEHYNEFLAEELDDTSDTGGRLSLTWIPSKSVTMLWMAETQQSDGPENTLFLPAAGETKDRIFRDTPSRNEREALYLAQDIVWDTRVGELTFALSHRTSEQDTLSDQDFSTVQPSDFPFALRQEIRRDVESTNDFFEVRWASPRESDLTAIAGVSYYAEDLDFDRLIDTEIDLSLLGLGPGVSSGRGNILTTIETKSRSAFAEATWAATKRLSFIGSLRYTDDEKELAYDQFVSSDDPIIPIIFAGSLPPITSRDKTTFTNWSPGIGADFRIDEDRSLYARVNTGFRAGGYNTVVTDPALLAYDEETSTNYEVGLKSEWLDQRLRLNFALFRFDQSDLLLRRQDPGDPSGVFTFLQNAGEARTYGAELEVAARPSRSLQLLLSYGWLEAELTDALLYNGPNQPLLSLAGARILDTPEYTGTFLVLYERPVTKNSVLSLSTSYRVRSELMLDYSGGVMADSYELLTASVGLEYPHWQFSFFGDNLTDDEGVIASLVNGAIDTRQGRTYGIRVGYRYR